MSKPSEHPNTSIFTTKIPKVDLNGVRLSEQARRKFERILEEHEKGHILRSQGLRPRYRILFYGAAGTGKAQPLWSKILTPKGWIPLGKAKVGDIVSTPNGSFANISGIFPQGKKEIISIEFEDGRVVECCKDHLWKVYSNSWKKSSQANVKSSGWRVIKTQELLDIYASQSMASYYIPSPNLKYRKKSLPLSPYQMGIMLGSGKFEGNYPTFKLENKLCLIKFKKNCPQGARLIEKKEGLWEIRSSKTTKAIEKLGLNTKNSQNKFIPSPYLLGSRRQRLELLEGLLDSQQELERGSLVFSTNSKELCTDAQRLCWSLGYVCKMHKPTPTKSAGRNSSRIKHQFKLSIKPTLIDPKELKLTSIQIPKTTLGKNKEAPTIKIKSVKNTGKKTEMQCISIDHPDHLYVTDNYIVTHNTLGAEAIAFHLNKKLHIFNLESISGTNPDDAMKTIMDGFRYINQSADVFLFDEFDAIANNRNSSSDSTSRRTSNALLIAFEQVTSPAILICATNFIDTVDPAFRRRFDTICKFELPSIDERIAIMKMVLQKYNMTSPEEDIKEAAKGTEGLSYHEAEELAAAAVKTALLLKTTTANLIPEIPAALERRNTFKQMIDES